MTEALGSAATLALAAKELVGGRFRLHGRDPATGLDCVGVLAVALEKSGRKTLVPISYALKMSNVDQFTRLPGICGFEAVTGPVEPGDVVLFYVGPCQYHLAIAAGDGGFIHAHAGLRRVIHSPQLPDWPVEQHWRITTGDIKES